MEFPSRRLSEIGSGRVINLDKDLKLIARFNYPTLGADVCILSRRDEEASCTRAPTSLRFVRVGSPSVSSDD